MPTALGSGQCSLPAQDKSWSETLGLLAPDLGLLVSSPLSGRARPPLRPAMMLLSILARGRPAKVQ